MKQTYEYDNASGNLLSRDYRPSGSATGLTESFSYDNLDRLTGSQVTGAGLMTVTYSPDGNINTKTDAGSYTYDPSKQNAVTSITGNNGTISLADQVITYNGNNLATRIEEDNSSYAIYYNPLKQRIKTVCTPVGGPAITRYYSGSYEKTITGSTVTETHYVISPTGLVAILVKQGTAVQTYYVETDHLGSVTGVINTDKTYASRSSYDAWGRRRNPTDWSYNNIPAPLITDRGFTSHEHLDRFGLINMNGRMYDPVVGRFLGVDPIVQAPDYSLSYTGYSYCWNNPLKYTDPSGMRMCADDYAVDLSAYSHYMTDIRFPDLGDSGYNENWLAEYLYASHVSFYGYSTSDGIDYYNYTGKAVPYKRGDKRFGHWETVSSSNVGYISGNNKDNLNNPNNISEITVAEKWVWDIPSGQGGNAFNSSSVSGTGVLLQIADNANTLYKHNKYRQTNGKIASIRKPNGQLRTSQQAQRAIRGSRLLKLGSIASNGFMAYNGATSYSENGLTLRNGLDMGLGTLGTICGVALLVSNPVGWVAGACIAVGAVSAIYGTATTGYDIYCEINGD